MASIKYRGESYHLRIPLAENFGIIYQFRIKHISAILFVRQIARKEEEEGEKERKREMERRSATRLQVTTVNHTRKSLAHVVGAP
jgi:hypothetical protein